MSFLQDVKTKIVTQKPLLLRGYMVMVFLCAIDISSKFLVADIVRSMPAKRLEIIPHFLHFAEVWNYGISFGLMQAQNNFGLWGLRLVTVAILCFLIYAHIDAKSKPESYGFACVMGGACGNIFDRFFHGAVYDFIDVQFFGWHFWTFNIADSAITIGAILLLYAQFFGQDFQEKKEDL